LSEADAIHVISQVCEGLHGAHKQGLIHRDVKPDNVLLTDDLIAKLTDLGLVRDVESDDNLTRTGRGLGTPYFMAPEQFRNAKHVDVRSDVYSLGATLYMSITGRPPFEKCSPLDCWVKKTRDDFPAPKELVPGISDRLDFAIRRAMRADPANRPRSCREFMEDVLGEAWKPNYLGPASGRYTAPPDANLWYLVYYENGHARTVKGQTATVRKNLQSGNFGELATVLVSRSKSGPFAPLKNTPEFRDLVCGGQTTPNSSPSRQRLTPTSQNSSANPGTRLAPTLPTNTPSPPRPATSDSTALGTDELPSVPVTNRATIDLDTSERPHLSTRKKHPLLPSSDTSSQGVRLPWWAMATLLFATLILGLLGGRFLF
jgi:serine/threonine protein kinase